MRLSVAEARVVVVVVDVDDERRLVEEGRIGAEPASVRAVERDHDPLAAHRPEARGAARRAP